MHRSLTPGGVGHLTRAQMDPIAALELDRPDLGEFRSVKAPDEALHVAGQMQRDFVRGRTWIVAGLYCAQVRVGEHAPFRGKTFARSIEPFGRHFGDVVDLDTAF